MPKYLVFKNLYLGVDNMHETFLFCPPVLWLSKCKVAATEKTIAFTGIPNKMDPLSVSPNVDYD